MVSFSQQVVYYIPNAYLSHDWTFVPFNNFHPFPQPLLPTNLLSVSVI